MTFLKSMLAAAFAAIAVATLAAAPAAAQPYRANNLSGEWQGQYAGEGNAPTAFELELDQSGAAISGTIVEYNTFAPNVAWLLSEFEGRVDGAEVRFTKTYTDTDAGVSHSVLYVGTLSNGGRRISGTWRLEGATGRFEMVR